MCSAVEGEGGMWLDMANATTRVMKTTNLKNIWGAVPALAHPPAAGDPATCMCAISSKNPSLQQRLFCTLNLQALKVVLIVLTLNLTLKDEP